MASLLPDNFQKSCEMVIADLMSVTGGFPSTVVPGAGAPKRSYKRRVLSAMRCKQVILGSLFVEISLKLKGTLCNFFLQNIVVRNLHTKCMQMFARPRCIQIDSTDKHVLCDKNSCHFNNDSMCMCVGLCVWGIVHVNVCVRDCACVGSC